MRLMESSIRIGTRGSKLALIQTEAVLARLRPINPNANFKILQILSGGDEFPEEKIESIGIGAFTSKLEQALVEQRIDISVHSLKYLPTIQREEVITIPVLEREDPRDVLVNRWGKTLLDLPEGARIGTSSTRRAAQLLHGAKHLKFLDIRGNVETRIQKSSGDNYDGVIIAAAGVKRLGMERYISEYLSPQICTPSPGQAAIAVEVRKDDVELIGMVDQIVDIPTSIAVKAERALLQQAGGGCNIPLGAHASMKDNSLQLFATLTEPDGSMSYRVEVTGEPNEPELLAKAAYQALIEQGAAQLLESLY